MYSFCCKGCTVVFGRVANPNHAEVFQIHGRRILQWGGMHGAGGGGGGLDANKVMQALYHQQYFESHLSPRVDAQAIVNPTPSSTINRKTRNFQAKCRTSFTAKIRKTFLLRIYRVTYVPRCTSLYLSVHLSIDLPIYVSIHTNLTPQSPNCPAHDFVLTSSGCSSSGKLQCFIY